MKDFSKFTFEDWMKIAVKRRWWIIIPTIFSVIIGVLLALTLPKYYRADTLVLVESQKVPENYIQSTVTSNVERRLQTIQEEVMSRTRLWEIIERFNLYPDDRGVLPPDLILEKMRDSIEVEIRRLDAFAIYYEGKDPDVVADVANALTEQFINANLKIREEQARETANFLEDMLREQEATLRKQETSLADFLQKHPGQLPEHTDRNLGMIRQLTLQLQTHQEGLSDIEANNSTLIEQISVLENQEPELNNDNTGDLLIQQLRTLEQELALLKISKSDTHPDVLIKETEIENLLTSLNDAPLDQDNNSPEIVTTDLQSDESKGQQMNRIIKEINDLKHDNESIKDRIRIQEDLLERQQALLSPSTENKIDSVMPKHIERNTQVIKELNQQLNVNINAINTAEMRLNKLKENTRLNSQNDFVKNEGLHFSTQSEINKKKNELEKLRKEYGPNHPVVQTRELELEKLITKTDQSATNEMLNRGQLSKLKNLRKELHANNLKIENSHKEITVLKEKIKEYEILIENAPKLEVELKDLTRKYNQERKQYEDLLAKNLDAELARKLELRQKGEQFIRLDEAVPPHRHHRPKREKIAIMSLFAGLCLGFGLALLREQFEKTFTDAKDFEGIAKIPVLASIPKIPDFRQSKVWKKFGKLKKKGKNFSETLDRPGVAFKDLNRAIPPFIQELYRILVIRMEKQVQTSRDRCLSFLVTSTVPSEGKTTTVTNLAWVMANGLNKKVVVVECDFYKPKISDYLGVQVDYGLSDYLKGHVEFSKIVYRLPDNKLAMIPAGRDTERSDRLLESDRMNEVIENLKTHFDYIIFDTPSIMATVFEADILTRYVDSILFIVRAEETPSDLVLHSLDLLDSKKLLGTVLNFASVPESKGASYQRYVQYRNSEYISDSPIPVTLKPEQKDDSRGSNGKDNGTLESGNMDSPELPSEVGKDRINYKNQIARDMKEATKNAVGAISQVSNSQSNVDPNEYDQDNLRKKIEKYLGGETSQSRPDSESENNGKTLDPKVSGANGKSAAKITNNTKTGPKSNTKKTYIRMVLNGDDGIPYADKFYELKVDGQNYHGKTDENGLVNIPIPADSKSGKLILRPSIENPNQVLVWPLKIKS